MLDSDEHWCVGEPSGPSTWSSAEMGTPPRRASGEPGEPSRAAGGEMEWPSRLGDAPSAADGAPAKMGEVSIGRALTSGLARRTPIAAGEAPGGTAPVGKPAAGLGHRGCAPAPRAAAIPGTVRRATPPSGEEWSESGDEGSSSGGDGGRGGRDTGRISPHPPAPLAAPFAAPFAAPPLQVPG